MAKKILLPLLLLCAGCAPKKDCIKIHHDQKSGMDVCMKKGWKVGEEAFTNFTIDTNQLRVKVITDVAAEQPYDLKKIWENQFTLIAAFNKPCVPLGDGKSILVDGNEGWIGTAHLVKTDKRPEYYETFVMFVHKGRQYFIDSRCNAPDHEKDMKLVEEVCAALTFGER